MSPISDPTYLLVHTVVGWLMTLGSALLLLPAVQFLRGKKSPLALDAVGHYFVAFAGTLNLVWGLALLSTSGEAEQARLLAWPSFAGFALMALFRVPFSRNEVILSTLGKAPRYEVVIFGVLAVFFAAAAL
ncbi:MAG: hypothetical protein JRH19_24045 [Deltaproteobacteria bacterium]|nr:hypothetical protein [Deltaproteobacteria bacterium]